MPQTDTLPIRFSLSESFDLKHAFNTDALRQEPEKTVRPSGYLGFSSEQPPLWLKIDIPW
jgi:hypothetical protein